MSLLKKFAFRILIIAVGLLIGIFITELLIRICLPYYRPDRQVAFYHNSKGVPLGPPNVERRVSTPKGDYDLSIRFNSYGFRDEKDFKNAKTDDLFVVGDSFAFGWGVESSSRFSNVLQFLIKRDVYNIAIPTDLEGYKLLLDYSKTEGAKINRLIVSICMENDLQTYKAPPEIKFQPASRSSYSTFRNWMKSYSALYLALSYEMQKSKSLSKILESMGLARRFDHDELMHRNRLTDEEVTACVEKVLAITKDYPHSIVLIIPSRALWVGENQETEKHIHEYFLDGLQKNQIRVVDMRTVFEQTGDPLKCYFKTDPHWNDEGHRLAGKMLFEEIQRKDL